MATATLPDPQARERETFARWKAELDFAQKDPKYVEWLDRSEKIVQRYRDERKDATQKLKRRMNILWSNVQTLMPAVYGKMPKPLVERRYMDRDPSARLASTILERVCSFQMEVGYYNASVGKTVLDYLLPGMGQVWVRYEPQFESAVEAGENAEVQYEEREAPEQTASEIEENGDGVPYERLAYERVCVDYVYYRDFLWGAARCWQEVPWVGRRCWFTRSEIAEKFYDGDLKEAEKITLDYSPPRQREQDGRFAEGSLSYFKKAEIWEIWNKADRTVYFIAPSTPDVVLKEEKNPVLKLENFWPCPEPLFSTLTNDSLIPVPDFAEYQDQAQELDDLTNRISLITTAVRANGVYDASVPALARLLQDGLDNKLIPVDSWAAFAEKGGMAGAVDLLPMQEIIEVLLRLYEARAQVKNDLYEVTGISDIVRGQSAGGTKTATEQRIKGQFASLRLQDRQARVAEFCRAVLRIMAEIVSEMFSNESLMQMSGVDQMMQDAVRKAVAKVQPPPMPPEMQLQLQGAPPQIAQQLQQQMLQQAQAQAAQQATQQEQEKFAKAVQILRSDKLRGFRVDIETDTTLQADAEADKQSAIELFTAVTQGINAIAPIAQAAPELVEPMGDIMLNAYRKFRVGRSMESGLEDALVKVTERLEEAAANPQPSPEQVKAQAEIQKQQMETQRAQEEHQMEMQAKQADFEMEKQRNAMEIEKMRAELEIEREKLNLERQKLGMEAMAAQQDAAIKAEGQQMDLAAQREQHAMDRESADHQHELGMQTMEAKAAAAKQQAKAKPNGAAK